MENSDKMIPTKAIILGTLVMGMILMAFQLGVWTSQWQRKKSTSIILAPLATAHAPALRKTAEVKSFKNTRKQMAIVKKEIKTLQYRAKKLRQELQKPHVKSSKKITQAINRKLNQILSQQEQAARRLHSLKSKL